MKNIVTTLALAIQFLAIQAYGQQSFTNTALITKHHNQLISFTLPSEANITNYRIEAANDTTNFQIIDKVRCSGNSVLPKTYNYTLQHTAYRFYRICQVGMNGNMVYSPVLNASPIEHQIHQVPASTTNTLANK